MRISLLAASVLLLVSSSSLFATPVQWTVASGGDGNYFDYVTNPNITWDDANAAAQAMVFDGVHGFLTTDTSAAETTFLASTFNYLGSTAFQGGWLGGFQNTSSPDYSEPAGGWQWVTGEPWVYTNWFPGEPDNAGGDQNYLRINSPAFGWDDMSDNPYNPSVQYISGYFVEYAVPEPASFAVIIGGAVLLLGKRATRRERRTGT
jgi:hypothetical protein